MTVIIKQATERQLKAVAKRLQQVIPAELNTPPLSLHQAQTIVAKGLGHADFHAAQRFHALSEVTRTGMEPAGYPDPESEDDVLVGPPDHIVEVLMQRLGRLHAPTWPHWRARRLLIQAAVAAAWLGRKGASLTSAHIREKLTPDDLHHFRVTAAGKVYFDFLHSQDGSVALHVMRERAREQHGTDVMDWLKVLPAPLSPDEQAKTRTFKALDHQLSQLLERAYPHSPSLDAKGVAHFVLANQGLWTVRASLFLEAACEALMLLMPPGVRKTQGHLLDLLDNLDLRWVLAHDRSPLPVDLRDRFRAHLSTLPGWSGDFSRLTEVPMQQEVVDAQNQALAGYWLALRAANS